jgi:hypothetical protein
VVEPIPNSSMLVFPTMIAPASRKRSTAVALYVGTKEDRIRDPAVVRNPRVQMLSWVGKDKISCAFLQMRVSRLSDQQAPNTSTCLQGRVQGHGFEVVWYDLRMDAHRSFRCPPPEPLTSK